MLRNIFKLNVFKCVTFEKVFSSHISSSTNALNADIRLRLACAYRALDLYGLNEGICNHLSAVAPSSVNNEEIFLIIPFGLHWSQVTTSKLIGINSKNDVVEGKGEPEETALCIHRGIYTERPDVKCVMHSHMPYATVMSCLQDPKLLMLHQNSTRFLNQVAYDDSYGGLGNSFEEGRRLAKVLGNKSVLLMGNHGVLTVGNSVAVAFDHMYYFERAAMVQVLALSTGCQVKELQENVTKATSAEIWKVMQKYAELHLSAVLQKLKYSHPDIYL